MAVMLLEASIKHATAAAGALAANGQDDELGKLVEMQAGANAAWSSGPA